jgi:hypothetical protein
VTWQPHQLGGLGPSLAVGPPKERGCSLLEIATDDIQTTNTNMLTSCTNHRDQHFTSSEQQNNAQQYPTLSRMYMGFLIRK